MCSATVLNGIVGKALQSSVYSEITEHAQHIAFALKTLPDIFKQNGKCIIFFLTKINLSLVYICWSSFQMTIEINYAIATLSDWLKNLAPVSVLSQ